MASIAVLPVLIGLAVDYAIQLQSRWDEEPGARGHRPGAARPPARRVAAPTIATAAVATAAGFLVLLLSPVPMVRGFGLLLVVGIVLAFACALTAGIAGARAGRRATPGAAPRVLASAWGELAAALAAAPASCCGAAGRRVGARPRAGAARGAVCERRARLRHRAGPARVLASRWRWPCIGWVADTQTERGLRHPEARAAEPAGAAGPRTLQRRPASSGEIDVIVEADDLTDPRSCSWMTAYQQRAARRYGYSDQARLRQGRRCARRSRCPTCSAARATAKPAGLTKQQIEGVLDAVPPYFSQAVITRDRRTAALAFGIRLMPLDKQQRRDRRHAPPAGPAGRGDGAAGRPAGRWRPQANADVSSWWRRC